MPEFSDCRAFSLPVRENRARESNTKTMFACLSQISRLSYQTIDLGPTDYKPVYSKGANMGLFMEF